MIYYFSGTGNTAWVARRLATALDQQLLTMAQLPDRPLRLAEDEPLGFVFPVYAWDMPTVVARFIERLEVIDAGTAPYVFMVCTCGDDIGRTDRRLARILRHKGLALAAACSVQMPNTYVCLPGFDVDSKEVEQAKMMAAEGRVADIAALLAGRKTTISVVPGSMPTAKTSILSPLFRCLLMSPKHFKTNDDCVGCGRCADVCPLGNISMTPDVKAGKRPSWGDNCAHCLACYHHCPHHAVAYGQRTRGKGQSMCIVNRA